MKKIVSIRGMMCAHCSAHVEKALSAVPGVSAVAVDLGSGTATVTLSSDVADNVLAQAVTAAGYEVLSCQAEA